MIAFCNKIKISKEEYLFQFQSHPSYPSALAFSDTLRFMGIKNDAYELDKEYWDELPYEFITFLDNSFSFVQKKNNEFIIYSDKIESLTKEELYEKTNNLVFILEKNIKQNTTKSDFNFKYSIYFVIFFLIMYSIFQLDWYKSLFNMLSLLGLFISLELFSQKFGHDSLIVNSICGVTSNNNLQSSCKRVFSSDKIDILGLKLSDFSLIYFLGITIVGTLFPQAEIILKIAAITSVFIIIYSLYVQFFLEKTLCRVCLIIIFILLSNLTISLIYLNFNFSINFIFIGIVLFVTLFFTVAYINTIIKEKETLKVLNAKNLRFKRNYELFKRELLSKDKIEFSDENIFFLGNKNAKLHISVISNPYCGFCKDAHKILEDLLSKYPDKISAQLRFNYVGGNVEEKYTQLISGFLNIYKNKSQQEFLKAIDSWFENRDEEEISKKTKSKVSEDLTDIIQNTVENIEAQLNFTPIFIINGYQFPDKYERDDIFYFIDDLLEDEEIMKKI
ncbi:vitamin K epoxide reductase family protein [Chryseobacterium binzhouense]|uniref:vitamin K epoxide reductase family protein n=1 Tax=Chryseobacterium binzhouense TaxID=2593646 RepID=UPI00289A0275|nr:vitamin K epoxide reductase family protein [Chryseobacterium binzhouense]